MNSAFREAALALSFPQDVQGKEADRSAEEIVSDKADTGGGSVSLVGRLFESDVPTGSENGGTSNSSARSSSTILPTGNPPSATNAISSASISPQTPIMAKMEVSGSQDPLEKEADQVAEQVTMGNSVKVQRRTSAKSNSNAGP